MGALRKFGWLFWLSLAWAGAAGAAEPCADKDNDACAEATEPAEPATMREAIDEAREDLAEKLHGVQVSAFGDVQSIYGDTGRQKLDWGAFELDVGGEFNDDLQTAFAIVETKMTTALAVGFLDYHAFGGGRIAPRGRLWVEKGLHFQLGRFDIPFGSDWQFFASKDSASISRPLTTDLVMEGGYNDAGLRILGNDGTVNFNAYLLHGFNAGRLVGGRLGLTPFSEPFSLKGAQEPKLAEFGLSYFLDADATKRKRETGVAVDAESHLGDWTGRLEYMVRKKEPTVLDAGLTMRGWHVTQEYELGESLAWATKLFVRYERVVIRPAEIATPGAGPGDDRDVRLAAGFSTNVGNSDLLQWKLEVQNYRAATPTTRTTPGFGSGQMLFTQFVVVL
ncbi:MAG: hypothetical protein HY849_05875 [Nitrosomonadales bacterium]|nr:hypothetical protein [Nitrosomonadales bacterium]